MGRILSFICKLTGAVTLLLLLAGAALLFSAGYWLPVQGQPHSADYLVVLAGSPSRAMYAADLYNDGLAPEVLVSRPWRDQVQRRLGELDVPYQHSEELNTLVLQAKGVPLEAISTFGQANLSTAQEAMELQERFANAPASLLVITSPYHVRRTRLVLEDLLTCCDFQVVGSPYEPFPEQWWQDTRSAQALVLETAKFIFYLAGGRFVSSGQATAPQINKAPRESS